MSRYTERSEYFHLNSRCKRCGKQDAYTLTGRSYCFECEEKNKLWRSQNYKKYGNKSMKGRYEKLKSKGLCVDCGKRSAEPNRTRCKRCLVKNNSSAKKTQGKQPRLDENCWLCNQRPPIENTKLCAVCLPKARERIKIAQNAVQSNKVKKKMEILDMQKYNISTMEKCEYVEAMKKVYCNPPEQKNGKCAGFKNKYNGAISTICKDCEHWNNEVKNEV